MAIRSVSGLGSTLMAKGRAIINATWILDTTDQGSRGGSSTARKITIFGGKARGTVQFESISMLVYSAALQCGELLIVPRAASLEAFDQRADGVKSQEPNVCCSG